MASNKRESEVLGTIFNFDFCKKQKREKFNPIEEWKAYHEYIVIPKTISVPESQLNSEQSEILNLVKRQCELSDSEFYKSPLRLIITGAAGTGKSVVLQHILHFLEEESKKREDFEFWAVAPTAVAAKTVGGRTIHSQFGITKYTGDLIEACKKMEKVKMTPNNVRFLIIDEVYMAGRRSIIYMDNYFRRCEGLKCNESFGGISVILSGDPWQLRPVKDSAIFEPPKVISDRYIKNIFRVYQEIKTVRILTIPNRQAEPDQDEFRQLLQRVCRREATPSDVKLLNTRRFHMLSTAEQQRFEEAVHIFPTNTGVLNRNL